MTPEQGKIAIFGNGPAGLSAAHHFTDAGFRVDLFKPTHPTPTRSVYTTSAEHPDLIHSFLTPEQTFVLPYMRVLTTRNTDVTIKTGPSYFMINNVDFVASQENRLMNNGVTIESLPMHALRGLMVNDGKQGVTIQLDGQTQTYDALIDATGVEASVAKLVDPRQNNGNYLVEWIYGATFRGSMEPSGMTLIFGPAGGTSWANPSIIPGYIDVVYTAFGAEKDSHRFFKSAKNGLNKLVDFLRHQEGFLFENLTAEDIYYGNIRNSPTLPPLSQNVFAIGESAGMAKPGTSDSWRRAIIAGKLVAEAVARGENPQKFYKTWRKLWNNNLLYAVVLTRVTCQTPEHKNGRLVDRVAHLLKIEGENTQLIEDIEAYFIQNKLKPSLLLKIFSSPVTIGSIKNIILKRLEMELTRGNPSIPWGLHET